MDEDDFIEVSETYSALIIGFLVGLTPGVLLGAALAVAVATWAG